MPPLSTAANQTAKLAPVFCHSDLNDRTNIIPSDVLRNVHSGNADAAIGPQIDALVFDRAPDPLDKDIVTPGTATIHGGWIYHDRSAPNVRRSLISPKRSSIASVTSGLVNDR